MRGRILSLAVLTVAASGCRTFGGHRVSIRVDSDPEGGRAYLVPLVKWDKSGGEAMIRAWRRIERYPIGGSQTTPFEAKISHHEQVLVIRKGNLVGWQAVTPDDGDEYDVALTIRLEE